ncbi:hypothetical protein M378DRAFT_171981 [Amanita muscaria Koide BX008]|uniref:Uncharacterized protein n=1 Tax=Amanita muscaria (strain Koide BX008) TaxID=946122 RepID=A0A0C2WM14_AMAMK|nr:hypothetical protein M378DRAFT_171981 [Amanita muscaria Koide BX008]
MLQYLSAFLQHDSNLCVAQKYLDYGANFGNACFFSPSPSAIRQARKSYNPKETHGLLLDSHSRSICEILWELHAAWP